MNCVWCSFIFIHFFFCPPTSCRFSSMPRITRFFTLYVLPHCGVFASGEPDGVVAKNVRSERLPDSTHTILGGASCATIRYARQPVVVRSFPEVNETMYTNFIRFYNFIVKSDRTFWKTNASGRVVYLFLDTFRTGDYRPCAVTTLVDLTVSGHNSEFEIALHRHI